MLWGRFGGRRIAALLAGASALALAVLGATSLAASGSDQRVELGMLIRLHDLPPGFVVDEEVGCGVIDPEGADQPLYEFIVHHFPRACAAKYNRLYAVSGRRPDPPVVDTLVFDVRNEAAAEDAEAVIPELISRATGNIVPDEVKPTASIGARTRLFHTHDAGPGDPFRGSLFVWRQGTLFGVTMAAGLPFAAADRAAARLARIQRTHMRSPAPYPESARDDLLVPLDNPAIELPVYWLGREFAVGGGAEPLELIDAFGPLGEGQAPPGTRIELSYDLLRIGTWTEASWRRYTDSKLGRELLTWHCTRTTAVPLSGGEATVYSGYPKDFANCPSTPPRAFSAVVKLGGVVLGLNLPICYTCVEGPLSAAQLETAVQGLRLRQPRDLGHR
jgi:hypothetical protein